MKRKVSETVEPTKKTAPPNFKTAPMMSPSYKPIFQDSKPTTAKPGNDIKLVEFLVPAPLNLKEEVKSPHTPESSSLSALLDELKNGPKPDSPVKIPSPTLIKQSKDYEKLCEVIIIQYRIELNIGEKEYGECKLQIVKIDSSKYLLIRNPIGKILYRLPLLSKPKLAETDSVISLILYDKEGEVDKDFTIKILTLGDKVDQIKELQDSMLV